MFTTSKIEIADRVAPPAPGMSESSSARIPLALFFFWGNAMIFGLSKK